MNKNADLLVISWCLVKVSVGFEMPFSSDQGSKHFPPPTCRQNIYAHTIPSLSLCLFLHQSPITHTHTHTPTPTHPLSVGDGEGKALQNICCKVRLQSVGLRIMLQ